MRTLGCRGKTHDTMWMIFFFFPLVFSRLDEVFYIPCNRIGRMGRIQRSMDGTPTARNKWALAERRSLDAERLRVRGLRHNTAV